VIYRVSLRRREDSATQSSKHHCTGSGGHGHNCECNTDRTEAAALAKEPKKDRATGGLHVY